MSADFTIKGDTSLDGSGAKKGISAFTMAAGNLLSDLAQSALSVAKEIGAAFINEGANLQQNIGGIETLYKESSDVVDAYANEAYKYGVSMNSYMEQATSFAAALNQSLGGNTAAAAEAANTAIQDMADNAAKMGTSIDSIQTAYQGFAKQNYTMLDNLKLGYGGTKEEMQRLLDDASKLSGVKYNMSSLADVYSAIHVVQENLGLTGVAAEEASETYTGAFQAMQAATSNLLADMANGAPIEDNLQQVADTAITFIFGNFLPMVANGLSAIPQVVSTAIDTLGALITEKAPGFLENITTFIQNIINEFMVKFPLFVSTGLDMISNFVTGIVDGMPQTISSIETLINSMLWFIFQNLPGFLSKGADIVLNLIQGLLNNLPNIIASLGRIVSNLITYLMTNLPRFLEKGGQIIVSLAHGLANNLPNIIATLGEVLLSLIQTIGRNLPQFLQKGLEIIGKVAAGLIDAIPVLVSKVPSIITRLKDKFLSINWAQVGLDILRGIANGIMNGASTIISAAQNAASSALSAAKRWLGIKSPSKVFRDQVGAFIPPGMAEGIKANEGKSNQAAEDMAESMVERARATVGGMIGTVGTAIAGTRNGEQAINASFTGQTESVIEIDGREVGRATAPYINEQLLFA